MNSTTRGLGGLGQIPLTSLKGVGPKLAERLGNINLHSVQDLLFHLPMRYEDRTRVSGLNDLYPGTSTNVVAQITNNQIKHGRKSMLVITLGQGDLRLTLRFFHYSVALQRKLSIGSWLRCYGEITRSAYGFEMMHPDHSIVSSHDPFKAVGDTLTPVYPTTDGLHQLSLRKLTEQALAMLKQGRVDEILPREFLPEPYSLTQALFTLHRPPASTAMAQLTTGKHPAQLRLIREELIAHNVSMLKLRQSADKHISCKLQGKDAVISTFLDSLPFTPTGAQTRVFVEISADLATDTPMMRLIQGDVGSGKTLVAALAALRAISDGYQVALMAPTEILAEQHAENFQSWFAPLGIGVGCLLGKTKAAARRNALAHIASGEMQLVIGTHAIFQEDVTFNKLTLIIIDEQHKFGVHQRLALREKGEFDGKHPHQLIMTATPIPRTLAMTAYADLDTSIIDELPPGRTPVTTVAVPDHRREEVIARMRQACHEDKRQIYWVCTLIEESEALDCQAAEEAASHLQASLPGLSVGLVHGRMKPSEKKEIMSRFSLGEIDVLVATTVIEVGVNVPNASLMIIENPERLGLAQLHQLRGRVGRGSIASHCLLLFKTPLSAVASERLTVLRESNDGFVIAERDLAIRGAGDLLGTRQTGLADLKIADLVRDEALIPVIQQQAQDLWRRYPKQAHALCDRWLADKDKYSNA
jgi:ATP-dependent DNA helicase RecG